MSMGNITVGFQAFSVCITHTLVGVSSDRHDTAENDETLSPPKFQIIVNSSLGVCAYELQLTHTLELLRLRRAKRGLFDTASSTCACQYLDPSKRPHFIRMNSVSN